MTVSQLHEDREKLQNQLKTIITSSRLILTTELEEAKQAFSDRVNETLNKLDVLFEESSSPKKKMKGKTGAVRKTFFPQDSHITVMLTEEHFRTIFNIGNVLLLLLN